MNATASPLGRAFARAADQSRAAFLPFMTAGFPDPETFLDIITALERSGAEVIEIGLPFSDPQADGPVIQAANSRVLDRGQTLAQALDLTARAVAAVSCPVVLMTYYNPVFRTDLEDFAARAAQAGAAGVIIPDLPPEEAGPWRQAAAAAGLETIFMAAPTTTPERLELIVEATQGFVYLVSSLGVTGGSGPLHPDLAALLARVKAASSLPVAVGFGISGPDQAAALAGRAGGVIVGSALVRAVAGAKNPAQAVSAVTELASKISVALGGRQPSTAAPVRAAAGGSGS